MSSYVEGYDVMCSVLSYIIISCVGDRLERKMSSYVKFYDFVEAYEILWSVL